MLKSYLLEEVLSFWPSILSCQDARVVGKDNSGVQWNSLHNIHDEICEQINREKINEHRADVLCALSWSVLVEISNYFKINYIDKKCTHVNIGDIDYNIVFKHFRENIKDKIFWNRRLGKEEKKDYIIFSIFINRTKLKRKNKTYKNSKHVYVRNIKKDCN